MNSDATFIIMYRVQSAMATLSVMSSLGAFGFDVWLLIREEMYWINTFYEHIDEYADILLVWAVELLMLVMTSTLFKGPRPVNDAIDPQAPHPPPDTHQKMFFL